MTTHDRSVRRVNQVGLTLGAAARQAVQPELVLVTPIGGLERRATTPMNLVCAELDDERFVLHWALPVDHRRLDTAPTSPFAADVFDEFWLLVDDELEHTSGPATCWESDTGVGRAPSGQAGWLEMDKARPWVELAELDDGNRLLVCCTAQRATHPRLQAPIHPASIAVTGGSILLARASVAELAHFAVLDPVTEGFRRAGEIAEPTASELRRAFAAFPQRAGGYVLREGGGG